ncbi:hypothetical protein D7V90_07930 [bacterium 1xD42-87]|nr:hypothetical protein D7V90_07930 [bacterium 1xD42-87]
MLYMSNDRKGIFKTEQECYEYEQRIKREKENEEKLEKKRQSRLNSINKKYEDLQKDIAEYKKDYGTRLEGYFTPFHELLNMLYR